MVTTKPCCWVECKTYSRYAQKLPKSLRELEAPGMKVFIPFPKPTQDIAKCKRWLVACSRDFFSLNITRNVYKFVLSTGQQKRVQQPNSLIRESYSTTNKSSACSGEKGSKINSGADNKDGEASRWKLCW